jgi:hypothetical protein
LYITPFSILLALIESFGCPYWIPITVHESLPDDDDDDDDDVYRIITL